MIRLQQLTKILPQLTLETVKGGSGIVGVIGGSLEYTGAPYYAAMAAVRMGADLAHIFCAREAAIPIKSYSPQLIVHPVFDCDEETDANAQEWQLRKMAQVWVGKIKAKFQKINSWVIGPGLGRSRHMSVFFPQLIRSFPAQSNIVIDADGLYFLCQTPSLLQELGNMNCILTPNHNEFRHLNKILSIEHSELTQKCAVGQRQGSLGKRADCIAKKLQKGKNSSVTVVIKGQRDLIVHRGNEVTVVNTEGSRKRCGGIGDVLSGCMGACVIWDYHRAPVLACHTVKEAARKAFQRYGRSLTGLGVLETLPEIVFSLDNKPEGQE